MADAIRFKSSKGDAHQFLSNFWPYTRKPQVAIDCFGLTPTIAITGSIAAGDGPAIAITGDGPTVHDDGRTFDNSEQMYQYYKWYNYIDAAYANVAILGATDAPAAKKAAGKGVYVIWKDGVVNHVYHTWLSTQPLPVVASVGDKRSRPLRAPAGKGRVKSKKCIGDEYSTALRTFVASGCSDAYMKRILRWKFEQNPALRAALISTLPRPLSELGRFSGEYWTHTGRDMLGQYLMEVRDALA
jgi:predicted NAD-dependent protein-ADP-ribosyltransferase YbiA (DUF1768 family)